MIEIQEHKKLVIKIAKEKWGNDNFKAQKKWFEEQNWNEMEIIKDNDLSRVLKKRKHFAHEIFKELLRRGKWFGYLYVPKGWLKK